MALNQHIEMGDDNFKKFQKRSNPEGDANQSREGLL
jgi:hypothetical protein